MVIWSMSLNEQCVSEMYDEREWGEMLSVVTGRFVILLL